MFRIKKLLVEDFCQHASVEVDLRPGVAAVIGHNGAGKSNLVEALFFGLTGELLGTGKLEDKIRWGQQDGRVELLLDDGTEEFTVERRLTGKHKLRSPSRGVMTKKSEINEALSGLIGLNLKLLTQVVFIAQGHIDDLLRMDHSARAAAFGRLFGLDEAERKREELYKMAGRIAVRPDNKEQIAAQRKLLADNAEQLRLVAAEEPGVKEALAGLEGRRALFEQAVHAPDADELQRQLAIRATELQGVQARMQAASDKLAALPPAADPPPADAARKAEALEGLPALREAVGALQGSLEALAGQNPAEPAAPCTAEDAADAEARARELAGKLALAESGSCDKCGQDYKLPQPQLEALRVAAAQTAADATGLRTALEAYKAAEALYRSVHASWARTVAGKEAELAAMQAQAAAAKTLVQGFDLAAYNACAEAYACGRGAALERSALTGELGALQAREASLQAERRLYEQQLPSAVDGTLRKQAADVLDRIKGLERRSSELAVARQAAESVMGMVEAALSRMEAEAAEDAAGRKVRDLFERARAVLHPDNLPRLAAAGAIARFNGLLAKYMAVFSAPFSARLAGDFDFRADYPDKVDLPVAVLSGGQFVVTAVACRMALAELLTAGCGLLVLDEPTAYLDGPNKRMLLDMLKGAQERIRAQGLTVLVPTNEEDVATVCDDVIRVS